MSRVLSAVAIGALSLAANACLSSRADASFVANPAITGSSPAFNGSLPASNVFDGTEAQYASATQGANTFLDFDFGAATTVDAFDIVNRPGVADAVTSFNLVFSANPTFGDAGDTTIGVSQDYTGVGTNYSGKLSTFAPQNARYVRWQVTGVSGAGNNNGATEMRFRSAGNPTRLAPATVTVYNGTTAFNPTYDRSNASDGALGNGANGDYSSNTAGSNTFLDFDLGSTQPVTGFELMQRMFASDRATSFTLLFSNDAAFATLVDSKSYTSSAMSFSDTFAAVNARYVRYDVTGGTGNLGAQEMSFLVVPEPGSVGVLALGLLGAGLARRRRVIA